MPRLTDLLTRMFTETPDNIKIWKTTLSVRFHEKLAQLPEDEYIQQDKFFREVIEATQLTVPYGTDSAFKVREDLISILCHLPQGHYRRFF
jgi:hypothetical protein